MISSNFMVSIFVVTATPQKAQKVIKKQKVDDEEESKPQKKMTAKQVGDVTSLFGILVSTSLWLGSSLILLILRRLIWPR